ncbi:MAG: nucleotidyltransferase [Candidatus Vogelbacteria bacterium CG10_big_fil_rev_8_21_14_0_10_51_16]|uniref:Nucleotidyltransferase n=1 Tax=Candidatus Vogelbacteria bacterium CG10_big_fil_rev_8_21_14_0_10_51_16 TaxID=1975045 RepID=A0A2H0RF34_9BACT|nr:MAG: nucleotidyltransferase [Candidatus Vogelbacteria bacterium CG10_big_fil_rev_8_21_14_0_10_51_16]
MSTIEAKTIVKKYAEKLRSARFPFDAIYLYGSCARGQAHEWSDVDVAVISPVLGEVLGAEQFQLWRLRRDVDSRIEPYGMTPEDFENNNDPMVHEIKTTGERIV